MSGTPQVIVVNSHGVGQYVQVKRLPLPGETIRGWNWRVEQDGGKGSNTAIALGRLGIKAAYVGKVGNDPWGDLGEKWMTEAGVDVRYLYRSDEISTGTGLVMVDETGMNSIVNGGSSGRALKQDEITAAVTDLAVAQILITGFEIPEELALHAARTAKRCGMITIVNPSPVPENDMGNIDYVDILILNETEAKNILRLNPSDPAAPKYLAARIREIHRPGCVIVTLGAAGSVGVDAKGDWAVTPVAVKAVDSAGAGDGYAAALAANLIWGKDVRAGSEWAGKYAAFTVTKMGTIPSYPHLKEINAFIARLSTEAR